MTEAEWLVSDDPRRMLKCLRRRWSRRKVRRFKCESMLLPCAILFSSEQLQQLSRELELWIEDREGEIQDRSRLDDFFYAAFTHTVFDWQRIFRDSDWLDAHRLIEAARGDEYVRVTAIVRDLAGNPFRPVSFTSSWRTSDVLDIAQRNYNARDFSALPILADALQDAGCNYDELLNHLRDSNAMHVRGCWALDLVLGKS